MSKKRRWGDLSYATRVRDIKGLQTIMGHLMPNRADAEVYLESKIDATNLVAFLEEKNASHPEYKTTIFHCFVTGLGRMIKERPGMNRFIQGRRMYERNDISFSFVAKRRFADGADEALVVLKVRDEDTLDSISKYIVGDVKKVRKTEHAEDGIDKLMDSLAKLPRPLLMLVVKFFKILDFFGKMPKDIRDGDTNYSTVLISNLGSIKGPAVYHHLNNYGTNSIMVTLGTLHKEEVVMPDGHKEIRDILDFGATIDERIGDGFYFVRSLKLIQYIFDHPEWLDRPIGEKSDFKYE